MFLNVFPANSVFSSLLYFCGEYNANRNSYKRKAFNWWCMCVCGGELDGSLGALPGRAEERKLQCRQEAFVLKASG